MPWPDIFFKSRKPKPLPEIATVPPKAAGPAPDETEKIEAARAEAAKKEKEKVESLRALSESGVINVPPRTVVKEAPAAAIVALPIAKDPPAHAIVTAPAAPKPEEDKSNAKTAVLPAAVPRPGSISLRQVAKLTDDARLPKKEEPPAAETPAPKPADPSASTPAPSAVVPPSFPVPVETGTVLEDKQAEKAVTPRAYAVPSTRQAGRGRARRRKASGRDARKRCARLL